jgi:hypothetical protein
MLKQKFMNNASDDRIPELGRYIVKIVRYNKDYLGNLMDSNP